MDNYSRTLSWLLRHAAQKMKLNMSDEGYVLVDEILNLKQMTGCDLCMIRQIVKNDNKSRFSLKEEGDKIYIRANQGHSTRVARNLDPEKYTQLITHPIVPCIHGTYKKFLDSINKKGLMTMSREYIHCASGFPNEVKSGMRTDCEIFIYVNMTKAMEDGIEFRVSDNGVIMTKGINGILDPKYFTIIENETINSN